MKRRRRGSSTTIRFQVHPEKTSSFNDSFVGDSKNNKPGKRRAFPITIAVIFLAVIAYLFYLGQDLPPLTKLERIDPALASHVYSEDGEIIKSFYTFNRTNTPFNKIPEHVIQALLATEDRRFFDHWGFNILGMLRALMVDIAHMEIVQGSSTLTMQLARNLFFDRKQTIARKLKETLAAIQIERTYSKKEIIEMYLNINFFGSGAFGIQSAARRFFSKDVDELTIEEGALLIGVLQGQTLHNPLRNPQRAFDRRNIVLNSMYDVGYLTKEEVDSLKQIPLNLNPSSNASQIAPYFTEYVRLQLNKLQDSLNVNVYEDGLRIYTTLNTEIQKYMEKAITEEMPRLQERVLQQKAFDKMREELSDSVFQKVTTVQLAFVCVDPHNGHILAMVGGRDFGESKWNRVTQMARQPGSAFKAFLYTAAMDNGYNPSDVFLNQPVVVINPDGTRWTPSNYNESVSGLMSLRDAIARSKNLVAIRLIQEIGPRVVADYAHRMGITTQLRPFPTLALGSSEVIPLELVSAYGIFANNGVLVKPVSILKIEDKTGNVIYRARPERREVLSKETTAIMNDLLQGVINRGTGYAVRRDYKFYQPAGGKTGTTNDYTDAWFVGFTPHLVAGVWVGFDDHSLTLGNGMAGSVAALPFWGNFMKTVYDSLDFPASSFATAANLVKLKICSETKKLITPYCPKPIEELFNPKYQPTETCDKHKGPESFRKRRRRSF